MDKINVTKSSMPPFEEYVEKIKLLWDNHWLTNSGIYHNELEEKLSKYLDVNNVSLFCNGHMALYNAIKCLDLKGEVITTPFTFVSTTHAIVQNGLKPVFCDIKEDDYTINPYEIEKLINDKTSAIVATHVYGNVCDVNKIEAIAKKNNLYVIYDAAHAFGVKYKGKPVGNYGDISMMSLHATKVFHAVEGGALLYNNQSLKDKLSSLRNFGLTKNDDCLYVSMNSKMSEFHAAMGLCNLKYIDENILKRKKLVERYQDNLKDIEGLKCWYPQKQVESNYIYFPILIDEEKALLSRDELINSLENNNVFARKYFYPLTSEFSCYNMINSNTKTALKISRQVLTLPLYSDLTIEEVDDISKIGRAHV